MGRAVLAVACFLLLNASPVFADFYRWVDKNGNEFFTNDPGQIPGEYRDGAEAVKPDDRRVSISEKAFSPRTAPGAAGEHRDKYGRGEEYWRRRAANLRLKLRDKQDEYDLVLRKIGSEERKPGKTGRKKKKSGSGLENRKMKLEREIASLTRELEAELPDEARKADAYPGWTRE